MKVIEGLGVGIYVSYLKYFYVEAQMNHDQQSNQTVILANFTKHIIDYSMTIVPLPTHPYSSIFDHDGSVCGTFMPRK